MSALQQASAYQALFRTCMKEAAGHGRPMINKLVEHCRRSMPQRAEMSNAVESRIQIESLRQLMHHQEALCENYPQALLAEFAEAIAGAGAGKGSDFSFDSLELMGEDQMQESVELVRAQQATALAVESETGELNALICAVQGLKSVQAERNPLRPEVYVRGLRTAILKTGVGPAVRLRWMQHMGEAMGPELAGVYRGLSQMLRMEGVTAAGFNIVLTPEVRGTVAPAAPAPPTEASTEKRAQALLNLRQLRKLLAGELDAGSDSFTAKFDREFEAEGRDFPQADFSNTVPAAFETLQEMKQVDKVMQRLADRKGGGRVDTGAAGLAPLREQLRSQARTTGQALGLEVVNLMVENIASDPRLLPPVQQTVRDLEPALLRLALTDPRFFSDRKHPARQLLEQLTQRSLAWDAVDSPGFAGFLDPLLQAVEALNTTRIAGAEPFAFALKSLLEAWGELQKRDRWHREKAVRTLLQAEQRNLLAEKVAKEMRGRPDVETASREMAHFVTGPWSQVIAQARLSDPSGDPDPGGYSAAVAELMWSSQPDMASGNTARLQRTAPGLIEKLQQGLASIDYPRAQARRFIEHLAALHKQALKPRAAEGAAVRPQPLSTSMTRAELEAKFARDDEENGTWLAPTEAKRSGFMDTHLSGFHDTQQSVAPKPLFQPTQAGFSETRPRDDASDDVPRLPDAGLVPGTWVEMLMDGRWDRNQLTWASPHGTLFMFTSGTGKTHSMTRRLLDKMLASGTLRLVSSQALVDGALDAVAQAALRNSGDVKF